MSEPASTVLASPFESPTLEIEDASVGLREAVDRARRRGESTVLTENGRPVARVVPVGGELAGPDSEGKFPRGTVGSLREWLRIHERMSPSDADAFAADVEEGRRIFNRPHVGFEWD